MDSNFFEMLDIKEALFIAPNATVVGNVRLEKGSSVWFGAVLRGDSDAIHVGENSNIQDNAVIHCDPGFACIIGNECVVGHGAVVHGATLHARVLVGMNATILNGAEIGTGSIIGANALVTQGMVIPPNSLVMGIPAKVVKSGNFEEQIVANTQEYAQKAKIFAKNLGQFFGRTD